MPVLNHGVVTSTFGSHAAARCLLLRTNSKTPTFHSKWTTGRHRAAEDAIFITHLQSFHFVIVVEEQHR